MQAMHGQDVAAMIDVALTHLTITAEQDRRHYKTSVDLVYLRVHVQICSKKVYACLLAMQHTRYNCTSYCHTNVLACV